MAISENIRQELSIAPSEADEFPNELDTRCRAMIKKECALNKRRKHLQSFAKCLRYAASVVIVLLALSSILFVSVEAIRVPIINYYISLNEGHLEVGASDEMSKNQTINIDWSDPLARLIPNDYSLSVCDGDYSSQLVAIYDNPQNDSIFFSIDPADSTKKVDTEDAQKVEKCIVAGYEAVIVVKNNNTTLVWQYEAIGKTFLITANSLSEIEMIDIAESIMQGITN